MKFRLREPDALTTAKREEVERLLIEVKREIQRPRSKRARSRARTWRLP